MGAVHAARVVGGGAWLGAVGAAGVVAADVVLCAVLGALAGAFTAWPVARRGVLRAAWLVMGASGPVALWGGVALRGWLDPTLAVVAASAMLAVGIVGTGIVGRRALPLAGALGIACVAAGLLVVSGTARVPVGKPSSAEHPNVLVVTVAGARADRFGAYVLDTPGFDRVVAEGVSARLAVTPSVDTRRAAGALWDGPAGLGSTLRAAGWGTVAIVGDEAVGAAAFGDAGFHAFDDDFAWPAAWDRTLIGATFGPTPPNGRRSDRVVDRALRVIDGAAGRFLLWVHLHDPMPPWDPPEPFDSRYGPADPGAGPPLSDGPPIDPTHAGALDALPDPRLAIARYDGEVAWADRQIARLLDAVQDRGLASGTLVVVVGLHGLGLDDVTPRFGLGDALTDGVVRVPLAMRLPGVLPRGTRLEDPVTLADIPATVRDLLGLDAVGDGVSLRRAWSGTGDPRTRVVTLAGPPDAPTGVGVRAPGAMLRWQDGQGWSAERFPMESDGRAWTPARVAALVDGVPAPAPDPAALNALAARLNGGEAPAGVRFAE